MKKNIGLIVTVSIVSILAILVATFAILWNTSWKIDVYLSSSQIGQQQKVNVDWETSKNIDKALVEVIHNGKVVSSKEIKDKATLESGNVDIDAFYGSQQVRVTVYKGSLYSASKSCFVDVCADEYIIAPITATMPVSLFTLNLKEITKDYTIPTFVWFKRSGAWDWNNLPNNVYKMPIANEKEFMNSGQKVMYEKTSAWVRELYEISPNSKFNFYYNDYYSYGWLDATIGNNIPVSNYNVTLLSDGVGSFSDFNKHFDNENYLQNYDAMKVRYDKVKEEIKDKGCYKENSKSYTISTEEIREFTYVMVKEESNVNWWLTRISGTMANNNPTLLQEITTNPKIVRKDMNASLNAMDDKEKANVKSLYNFSDEMFEKAKNENKNAMVILGTWTKYEHNFDDYVFALKKYYGDSYVYYYKGHPRNPTNSEEGKLEKLTSLGLIDVDSTIPAEIIMFFNPEIFLSGYPTSAFINANPEKCCAVFNVTKENCDVVYKDRLDIFITKLENNDAKYGSLCEENAISYLVEFNDTTFADFAIINSNKKEFVYYKENGSSFDVVTK